MTNRFRWIALGTGAALIALGLAAAVYASTQNTSQDPRPFRGWHRPGGAGRFGGPGGPMGMLPMLGPRLGLTDAQKEQIKGIADSHRDEWKALADRGIAARDALHAAVTADTIDEAAIREKSAAVAAVQADMAIARARVFAQVFQLLTPDQQAQAKTMRSQMRQRGQRMRPLRGPQGPAGPGF